MARYRQGIESGEYRRDPAQAEAIVLLQDLFDRLVRPSSGKKSLLARLLRGGAPSPGIRGLYLWGGVGRGKTFLMDLLYEALPGGDKTRLHFHHFMREVHRQLGDIQGEVNPLKKVAANFAARGRVICFDEFFVSDITDAMLLAGLLEDMFRRRMVLVATSNLPPDDLYRDGLQRSKFLPAISLLQGHTLVHRMDGGVDYRLRALRRAEIYHYPLDEGAEAGLEAAFKNISPGEGRRNVALMIEGRRVRSRWCADGVVWFDFPDICEGPRSQNDYIEIARLFQTVLVGKVPVFDAGRDDRARRFISLVDEFYDRNVKLIVSAQAAIPRLYRGERLKSAFRRTESRLHEMQSLEYLGREHRA